MLVDYSDDKELLEVLKCGKISAFEYIYTTYYDSLLNYADRLLNDLETARDVVQQMYYKIWEGREVLNISLSVKAYLFKSVYYIKKLVFCLIVAVVKLIKLAQKFFLL